MVKSIFKDMVLGLALCLALVSCSLDRVISPSVESKLIAEIQLRELLGIRKPGDVVRVTGYCAADHDGLIDFFVNLVTSEGFIGYQDLMLTDGIPCFDSRILENVPVISVVLVEFVKTIRVPVGTPGKVSSGTLLEIWKITDMAGVSGFTWLKAKGVGA